MTSEFQEISPRPPLPLPDHQISLIRLDHIDFLFDSFSSSITTPPSLPSPSDSIQDQPPVSISAVDDDEEHSDGFTTPISSHHKIPVIPHCPPAPSRPKPISLSRTLSARASAVRRGFLVYISDEIVDSIFSDDLLHHKSKKARKDDDNGGE
ncbi:cyclin-dependent protein kinase inhibitor SMR3-like [Cucumis melo var. makuwa]|uniref:Cyclin-dependent protein kinase inhibitor SMR3-like n=2 Tax=Cucumis melo TaxID=3656 RepID=A0A5A7SN91_CUCMM|nr:cyclin-dependent protein kinase inhibitor SMR3-like [Cucumis melo var. makuwa]TYK23525.1 cyclin-dependent protein kinase inhibitor SMR3-like [Cucumis melo var. makuwa]